MTLNGVPSNGAGGVREFLVPGMEPGRDYVYRVHARWSEGGREVARDRDLVIRAGDRVAVDMTNPG